MLLNSPPTSLHYLDLTSKKRKLNDASCTGSDEMSEMGKIVLQLLADKKNTSEDSALSSGSYAEESFGIEHETNNIKPYLDFIHIKSSKKDDVFETLDWNDITSFKFFKSKSITHDHMSRWGLSDGIIAQLCDNVAKYERHLSKT